MDIQMPVMDGISATKEIHRLETDTLELHRRKVSAPVSFIVIITIQVATQAARCNDFLTKPVSLEWRNNKTIEWGYIKALGRQMFADSRPDFVMSMSAGQAVQAENIARWGPPSWSR
jgi:osomolarity two-component system response regulator SSK1